MKKLIEDITVFANVLGVSDPDLVWSLATIPWKSTEDRDKFVVEIGLLSGGVEQ